ncbi:hypothetical protein BB559_000075 [Furculomyces boomerangus]|uniref:Deacetylase sirtuin-type domain-containing protein n=2 Tax=Harpellales TaxID=61421 RepID=A0A2T9Z6I6_9FUNG|nr:hypothetical protein BB559_000075 [Furculomyces boomerangus]PWA00625.1 hypothetical protein BB558_003321 [Smittium angustum]
MKKMRTLCLKDLNKVEETNELTGLPHNLETWWKIKKAINNSRKCIIVTGAGISVSSGIPDFRSSDGLFEQLKKKYPKEIVNGKDLFDANLFKNPRLTKIFYHFMGELKQLVDNANLTPTHKFIKKLDEEGRLLRCYTQNIDNLEKVAGLQTSFLEQKTFRRKRKSAELFPSKSEDINIQNAINPNNFTQNIKTEHSNDEYPSSCPLKKSNTLSNIPNPNKMIKKIKIGLSNSYLSSETCETDLKQRDYINTRDEIKNNITNELNLLNEEIQENSQKSEISNEDENALVEDENVTFLENKRKKLVRTTSGIDKNFTKAVQLHGSLDQLTYGEFVPCPICTDKDENRSFIGKRLLGIGMLRPDIVLYNETHPHADIIGTFSSYDLRRKPDLLIVMGTSLRIPGVKRLVREIAKSVEASTPTKHKTGSAKSIFINCGPPTTFGDWESIFDYFIDGPSDTAVDYLDCNVSPDNLPLSVFIPIQKQDVWPYNTDFKTISSVFSSTERVNRGLAKDPFVLCTPPPETILNHTSETTLNRISVITPEVIPVTTMNEIPGTTISEFSKATLDEISKATLDEISRATLGEICEGGEKGNGIDEPRIVAPKIREDYFGVFSDPSTLTDICSSDIENFSDTLFDDFEGWDEVFNIGTSSRSTLVDNNSRFSGFSEKNRNPLESTNLSESL